MRNFLMGVAAIALAAGGAHAQPGNGNGKNDDNGGGKAKSEASGHAGKAANGGSGHGNDKSPAMKGNGADRVVQSNGNDNKVKPVNHGNGGSKADRDGYERSDYAEKGKKNDNGNGNKAMRMDRDDDGLFSYGRRDSMAREYGLVDGCPPGLAKKNNGCTPPGLAKREDYRYDRANYWGLPGLSDGRYRYYDNNLVRLSDTGSILGYYPLLGGALSAGNVWPNWFDYQPVPSYYESYYGLGSSNSYRYADNALYRVDPETSAITAIAALLTGDNIKVGQPMPSGYSVYNVPYGYRDRYADGPNSMYRYSDGYVYEIDPTTMLVSSVIEAII
ncbi:hypothetical protein EKN06_10475 [Croceicoccus ponticola]|uniref:DUF1236 domain-containing protein n=1 Tax=Croceicoccus ponticola TaxID=2217664 RepID=A0A437GWG3_9SPHN|nr:hypothetical protein [Croceicoccus ponticola]RVQ66442.1 hypothetical protein EKN06_10475 [Croceicoccus ponticola]